MSGEGISSFEETRVRWVNGKVLGRHSFGTRQNCYSNRLLGRMVINATATERGWKRFAFNGFCHDSFRKRNGVAIESASIRWVWVAEIQLLIARDRHALSDGGPSGQIQIRSGELVASASSASAVI